MPSEDGPRPFEHHEIDVKATPYGHPVEPDYVISIAHKETGAQVLVSHPGRSVLHLKNAALAALRELVDR